MKTIFNNNRNISGLTMRNAVRKTMLSVAFTAATVAVNAQVTNTSETVITEQTTTTSTKFNRFAIGLRLNHLYDVYYSGFEQLNNGFRSEDMKGMNGSKTKFDMAFGLDLTYFISPRFSMDAAFDIGTMTGSNSLNYYKSDVQFYTLGANYDFKSGRRTKPYKFVPYLRASIALANYDVKQMLLEDDGVLGEVNNTCLQSGVGLGIRYHISNNLLLNLSSEFVTSYTDAWDGYDYGSGRDYMVKSNIGIRYTFGKNDHIDRIPLAEKQTVIPNIVTVKSETTAVTSTNNDSITDALKKQIEDLRREVNEKLAEKQDKGDVPVIVAVDTTKRTVAPKEENVVRVQRGGAIGDVATLKKMMQIEMHVIDFEVGSALLDNESKNTLSKIARIMRDNPDFKLTLHGYCDQDGSVQLNERLGKLRSQSAANYLVGKGVDRSRLNIVGYGKTNLVDEENSVRAKTLNRRVEFSVE